MKNHSKQKTQRLGEEPPPIKKIPFYQGDFLAKYINYILKVLVIFGIAVSLSLIVKVIFKLSPMWMFILTFLLLLAISPLTSKINFKIGYTIQQEYDKFLERQTKKIFGK